MLLAYDVYEYVLQMHVIKRETKSEKWVRGSLPICVIFGLIWI